MSDIPFPTIFVINLEDRPDRLSTIQKHFSERRWPNLHRINAIRYETNGVFTGWIGCTLSHIKAVKVAKRSKLPWILILEDDCLLADNALKRFCGLLPSLWARRNEWDVFIGGMASIVEMESVVQESPLLLKAKGTSSHFCVLHQGFYDILIESMIKKPRIIDELYSQVPSVKVFCTIPHLATQTIGISDIDKDFHDYTDTFDASEKKLADFVINAKLCKTENAE